MEKHNIVYYLIEYYSEKDILQYYSSKCYMKWKKQTTLLSLKRADMQHKSS